jgi:hypothetical protein
METRGEFQKQVGKWQYTGWKVAIYRLESGNIQVGKWQYTGWKEGEGQHTSWNRKWAIHSLENGKRGNTPCGNREMTRNLMKTGKGTCSIPPGNWKGATHLRNRKRGNTQPGNREVAGNTPHGNRKRSLETERWQHSSWKQEKGQHTA